MGSQAHTMWYAVHDTRGSSSQTEISEVKMQVRALQDSVNFLILQFGARQPSPMQQPPMPYAPWTLPSMSCPPSQMPPPPPSQMPPPPPSQIPPPHYYPWMQPPLGQYSTPSYPWMQPPYPTTWPPYHYPGESSQMRP